MRAFPLSWSLVLSSLLISLLWDNTFILAKSSSQPDLGSRHTNNWAVLVCSSRYWFNYRVSPSPQYKERHLIEQTEAHGKYTGNVRDACSQQFDDAEYSNLGTAQSRD